MEMILLYTFGIFRSPRYRSLCDLESHIIGFFRRSSVLHADHRSGLVDAIQRD